MRSEKKVLSVLTGLFVLAAVGHGRGPAVMLTTVLEDAGMIKGSVSAELMAEPPLAEPAAGPSLPEPVEVAATVPRGTVEQTLSEQAPTDDQTSKARQRLDNLRMMAAAMPADRAARLIEALPADDAVAVLTAMPPTTAAMILAETSAPGSARIARAMATTSPVLP